MKFFSKIIGTFNFYSGGVASSPWFLEDYFNSNNNQQHPSAFSFSSNDTLHNTFDFDTSWTRRHMYEIDEKIVRGATFSEDAAVSA